MYDGQTLGLMDTWVKLATILSEKTTLPDGIVTYHSAALHDSLAPGAPLKNNRFISSGSRRVKSPGFDAKTTDELLRALLQVLSSLLGISCSPSGNTVRAPEKRVGIKEEIDHLVVVGCSHMPRVSPHLRDLGYRVTDCAMTGTIPDNASITALVSVLPQHLEPGSAIVFDLFGNFSYQFEQEDGSMALPILLGGKYLLLGKVGVCSDTAFKSFVKNMAGLFAAAPGTPKVILPTIPRYISGSCCVVRGHGDNAGSAEHPLEMTEKVTHLRKLLRTELGNMSLDGNWVPDILSGLVPSADGGETPIKDSSAELGSLFSGDNVHLTPNAYAKLADTVVRGVGAAVKKSMQAECQITGEKRNFYWRGFSSPRGSTKLASMGTAHYRGGTQHTGERRGGGSSGHRGRHMRRGGGGGRNRGSYAPF